MGTRPGGEPCNRCGALLAYADLVRVVKRGQKRPVWVCVTCRDHWKTIGRIR